MLFTSTIYSVYRRLKTCHGNKLICLVGTILLLKFSASSENHQNKSTFVFPLLYPLTYIVALELLFNNILYLQIKTHHNKGNFARFAKLYFSYKEYFSYGEPVSKAEINYVGGVGRKYNFSIKGYYCNIELHLSMGHCV